MDIDTKCLSVFKSFISDIIKVFPEYDIKLTGIYGSLLKLETCKIEEQEELQEFLSRVHKLNKKITNKDECIFEEDELINLINNNECINCDLSGVNLSNLKFENTNLSGSNLSYSFFLITVLHSIS